MAPRPAPHLPPEATGSSFFRVEVVRMAEEGGGGEGGKVYPAPWNWKYGESGLELKPSFCSLERV